MALRFGIKTHMRDAELLRRNAYERMFKHTCARSSAKILTKRSIRTVMQSRHCFRIWTHLDATMEYAIDDSDNETAFFFQRDWSGFVPQRDSTKLVFLRLPFRICISEPGVGKFYYRVRSVGQLRRALDHWAAYPHMVIL
jgi:hypothetical protein